MAEVRGPGFEYELIRRTGQKRINIRISQTGRVTVSAPREIPDGQISATVAAKRSWVLKHLDTLRSNRERNNPLHNLLIQGIPHAVERRRGRLKRGRVTVSGDHVLIESVSGGEQESLEIIEKWLKTTARRELEKRSAELSEKTGIPYKRLFLRNQRTRWGSSSGRGNISLNWRTIMLPPQVRDYLIVHELCHQRHLNHSAAYWKLVHHYYPGFKKAELWLKANRGIMGLFRE